MRARDLARQLVMYEQEDRESKGDADARRAALEKIAPRFGISYRMLERRLVDLNRLKHS
jgi:Zn-dependent peptidase ImmA (M78 family)